MLIVGGTGFIGRHLCAELSRIKRSAVAVSRSPDFDFLENHAPTVDGVTLDALIGNAEHYFSSNDSLVYLASQSVPATFATEPWNELVYNVRPAFELFDLAIKTNKNIRIVFVSSGGTIYGAGHSAPVSEDVPAAPISAYGYGKLAIEESLKYLGRTRFANYAILRVSNPIGLWQTSRGHGIVAAALRASASGTPLSLYSHGQQIRDFIDADDLASAIIKASEARGHRAVTWNIGSGKEQTISNVVDIVSKITNKPIKRNLLPAREFDVSYAVLNCQKVYDDISWRAETDLEQSIQKLIH